MTKDLSVPFLIFFSEPFHFPGEIGNGSGTLATDIFKPPKPLLAKGFGSLNILKV